MEKTKEILEKFKSIAVFGMSSNPSKPAYYVPKFLMDKGYEIFPINPKADEIAGRKVYRDLLSIPEKVEVLEVFRPSDQVLEPVKQAVERKKKTGDIKAVWLQEGITNEEAKKLAEENGLSFVQNKCMYKEYYYHFS